MSDVVVTVPKALWWDWLEEGDLPDEPYDGTNEYHFFGRGNPPEIKTDERVYIVAHGMVRGYAPLVYVEKIVTGRRRFDSSTYRISYDTYPGAPATPKIVFRPLPLPDWWWPGATYGLVRWGRAVACTIPEPVRGFRGWRYRWWSREDEVPFPDYQTRGVVL